MRGMVYHLGNGNITSGMDISPRDIHNGVLTVHEDAFPSDRTVCRCISDIKTGHFELNKR